MIVAVAFAAVIIVVVAVVVAVVATFVPLAATIVHVIAARATPCHRASGWTGADQATGHRCEQ
jgi:hypothetical protein